MRKIASYAGLAMLVISGNLWAACSDISWTALNNAVSAAAAAGGATGGYGLNMWATVVDPTGAVCWVTTNGTPGADAGNSEWLGSRVISAQKANTANAFSLDGYAISTANLYSAVQPGGSLYGLQASNPVDATIAYAGSPAKYGTINDPLRGKKIGGVNVFGGGLALYANGKKVGALGVSGDTSCRDHAFAWRIRSALGMQPAGVGITTVNLDAAGTKQTPLPGATVGDEMILGTPNGASNYWNAWAQPYCPNSIPAISGANGTLATPSAQ
ncbi:MAG: hypothetical protein RLZ25_146 [Pseudomonadota bacterium]